MFSWYDENYISRQPITVDFSTVTAIPATHFVEVPIPASWDQFWDNTRSDGKDIVVTDVFGTKVNFQFKSGFNLSAKSLTLEIGTIEVPAVKSMKQLFLYYNYPNESATHTTSISPSSPKNGHIDRGAATEKIVEAQNIFPSGTAPTTVFQKQSTEEIDIFFSLNGLLQLSVDSSNGRVRFEEVEYVTVKSLDSTPTNSDARYALDETRFISGFVKARAKAGDSGSSYAFGVEISTTTKQIYDIRCLLKVKDLLPS